MKKFRFLVKYGLFKRIKRKSFVISNIVIFILLTVIINLPAIIGVFSNDEISDLNVVVYNQTAETTLIDDLDTRLNAPFETDFYIVSDGEHAFVEDAFWDNADLDIALVFHSTSDIDIYSKNPEYNQTLANEIELLLIDYQIPGYQSPQFAQNFAPDYEDPEQGELISALSSIVVLPLFFLITMATQFVGADIIEEKSTKAIETIIASVPIKTHFMSKISAALLFVLIQGALFLLYAFVATLLFGGASADMGETTNLLAILGTIIPNWRMILLLSIFFMIAGTLFYLMFSSMLASMAVTQEDYQQFQSPIMMTLLVGFYIALFSGYIDGALILKIATFIPFFTPIVAPVAFASGALTLVEAIIALVMMIAFLIGSFYVVTPVYRVAILNYDQTKFGKRIKGYFKKAFHKRKKEA